MDCFSEKYIHNNTIIQIIITRKAGTLLQSWRKIKNHVSALVGEEQGDTNTFDNKNESSTDEKLNDYNLPHDDILQAQEIEPYYDLFRLFGVRTKEMITICLGAIRTLARQTDGFFTREEMERELSYLYQPTRTKVIRILQGHGWITSNGIRYEIPEKVRNLLVFLFGALTRSDESFAQAIDVSFTMSDLDEVGGTEEEKAEANFEIAIGTLRHIRTQLQRVLEQKSPTEARRMLFKSKNVREAIEHVEQRIKQRNRKSYKYAVTTEVRTLCAEIIRLHQELLLFIHQSIQSNARAFGQYLTPEQIEEFIDKASLGMLERLAKKHFASPITPLHLSKIEILQRGTAYLQHRPEIQEPTPPPPMAEIKRRDITVKRQKGSAAEFYRELISLLEQNPNLSLSEVVVKNSFGESLFRTGLLTTIRRETADDPEQMQLEIVLDGTFIDLDEGPVARISKGVIRHNVNVASKF